MPPGSGNGCGCLDHPLNANSRRDGVIEPILCVGEWLFVSYLHTAAVFGKPPWLTSTRGGWGQPGGNLKVSLRCRWWLLEPQIAPFLPNFSCFPKSGKVCGMERVQWESTEHHSAPSTAQCRREAVCEHQHQVSEEGIQLQPRTTAAIHSSSVTQTPGYFVRVMASQGGNIAPAPLTRIRDPDSIRTTLLLVPLPCQMSDHGGAWLGAFQMAPFHWGCVYESALTLLCGAHSRSLNFTDFHLKDPVLWDVCGLLLVALYTLACACSFYNREAVCAAADIFCRCNLSKTFDVSGLEVAQGMPVFVMRNTGQAALTFPGNNAFEVRRSTHKHKGKHLARRT